MAAAAKAGGREVFLIGLDGYANEAALVGWPHVMLRLGAAGRMLTALRAHNCRDLVLVGPVRRPSVFDLRPDAEGVKILARIGRAAFAGDDGLLAAVVRVLGEEGFRVVGAHEILTEILAPPGQMTQIGPDQQAMVDILRGVSVVQALGAVDVGQACVVQQGIVLSVEAIEGTDAMLARTRQVARPGPGGVLVKLVKPGQDRRADLPTLGPDTIRAAAAAGLRGIAFEGNGTILTERDRMVQLANEAGLFMLGLDIPG